MNKTKKLAIECGLTFLMFFGVWWWVGREYGKPNQGPVKVYLGHWKEDIRKVGDFYSVGYIERGMEVKK